MSRQHAIVIGAGAAGCLAARVLSDHYAQVTVVERDTGASSQAHIRRGLPQGAHVHNVLYRGNQILEKFYPGFFGAGFDLERAPVIEVARDQRLFGAFGWNPSYETGMKFRGYSRQLLDRELIAHTQRLANVKFKFGFRAENLIFENSRVVGLKAVPAESENAELLQADLVVDSSGRGSQIERWLKEIGAGTPEVKKVAAPEGYATRTYKLLGESPSWRQFAILRKPPERARGAYVLSVENNRWLVTLVGAQGDFPPGDEAGFLEFAKSLATPDAFWLIEKSQPEGPISLYRKMESTCRFVDRMANWPDGLLLIGDSLCTFNPIFGQGITTAAVSAEHLDEVLKKRPRAGWERRFHRGAIGILRSPWLFSVRENLVPDSARVNPWPRFRHSLRMRALRFLQQAVPHDPVIHLHLYKIQNLIAPLSSIFAWRMLLRARKKPELSGRNVSVSNTEIIKKSA